MISSMKWFAILVLVLFGDTWADNSVDTGGQYTFINCPQLKSQESLDLEGIMGKWYVVEVLDHKIEGTMREMTTARVVVDSCPIIKLKTDDRGLLRLLWKEEAGDLEYTFRVPDPVRAPGFWLSTSQQNGTLTLKTYAQFAGTVHVMKAVGNHMVLTFCAEHPDNQLYSVLMSREHILQRSNIKGVHNLLGRRRLNIVSIRETCAKGGGPTIAKSLSTLTLCLIVSRSLLTILWQ